MLRVSLVVLLAVQSALAASVLARSVTGDAVLETRFDANCSKLLPSARLDSTVIVSASAEVHQCRLLEPEFGIHHSMSPPVDTNRSHDELSVLMGYAMNPN